MKSRKLHYSALVSFVIFLVIATKDILVSYLELIPERGPLNAMVSWFLILPLSIIGFTLSVIVIKHYCGYMISRRMILLDGVLLLSLPTIMYISYFFIQFALVF